MLKLIIGYLYLPYQTFYEVIKYSLLNISENKVSLSNYRLNIQSTKCINLFFFSFLAIKINNNTKNIKFKTNYRFYFLSREEQC